MNNEILSNTLKTLFLRRGFNLFHRIRPEQYDRRVRPDKRIINVFPNAHTVFLAGFAGSRFWEILKLFLAENPWFKTRSEHWVDEYSVLLFESAKRILDDEGANYRMVFPFGHQGAALDFSLLGEVGGIGVKSLLGLLLHPVYGTWISLRGAIVADFPLPEYDEPLTSFDPCPPCSKPCISACPAQTISENGWDYQACMQFRLDYHTCSTNCASRRACPYGEEHQYSDEQLAYHHRFVLKSVRKHFGME